MKNIKFAVLALACAIAATGCREDKTQNEAGLSEATAVAGAECNTVIELKPEHHAA